MITGIGLAFIVIIACSIYLYNEHKKGSPTSKESKIVQDNWITEKYALIGGFLTLLLFLILESVLKAVDVQGFILIATVVLSSIICGCTGLIVKILRSFKDRV